MVGPAMRNWFGRGGQTMPVGPSMAPLQHHPLPLAPDPLPTARPMPAAMPAIVPTWPAERIGITDALWGEGYQFPGGEIETLRLAKPLGLSSASSLLLVGAGGGGPACALAEQLGVWVSGFEENAGLGQAAAERIASHKLAKRVRLESWDPAEPGFPRNFYHHCLALEPLRNGKPEPTLAALAGAIKPGGQLMMIDLVADSPLDPADPVVARWAELERRNPADLPAEITVTRVMGRLGFDVRIVENISRRHMDQALLGWRTQVRAMEDVDRPDARQAALLVREAELWLMRLRLFRAERLRMVRWHAITRSG